MCGLAGVLGDLTQEHKNIFKDLMRVASLRGVHSSGVIGVDQKNDYRFAKEVGEPAYLFDTKRYDQATNGFLSALIGHCRHKTSGEINRQNAHPFDFPEEGIIGVHNGTLRSHHQLDTYHHSKVDSEVLYGHLAQNGPEETFNSLEGAWACVWFDANTGRIHFIRNKERTLYFCWTKDSRALFWASEPWMLSAVERKIELHCGDDEKNPKKVFSLPTDTMWTFSVTPNDRNKKVHFHNPVAIAPKEVRGYQGNWQQRHGASSTASGSGATGPGRSPQQQAHHHQHNQAWKRNPATGVSERTPLPNPENKAVVSLASVGGQVVDPFKEGGRLGLPSLTLLDDPLPGEETGESGADAKKTTALSDVNFLRTSLQKEGSKTPTTTSSSSRKEKLSLPSRIIGGLAQQVKEKHSAACGRLPVSTDNSGREPRKTSLRQISGLWYITDNKSKDEYSEAQFEANTKAECMFCHEPIGGLEDVHEFLDKNNFMCRGCVTEPTIPDVSSDKEK